MADAVQARIEREARFASDVSHELRSPITALPPPPRSSTAGAASFPTARSRRSTSSSARSAASTPWSSTSSSCPASTPARPSCTRRRSTSSRLCRRIIDRNGFRELPLDVPDHTGNGSPLSATVDKLRFERILANLLENANHHGGGLTRVSIERTDGPFLLVVVEDAGPGVARGERLRIFERFARGSAARHRIGTGLGLALVSEHATAQGGDAGRGPAERRCPSSSASRRRQCGEAASTGDHRGDQYDVGRRLRRQRRGELQRIGSDNLAGLDQTTTTSSTTTTTIPPSTTMVVVVSPTTDETTTTIATETVQLYFLDGSRLVDISINLAGAPSVSRVIAALEAGPPTDEVGIGLQTLLPSRLITSVAESGAGFATVDLASGPFEGIQPRDQRLAIAQIVLTATARHRPGAVHPRRRTIGRARAGQRADGARCAGVTQRLPVAAPRAERRDGDHARTDAAVN